MQILEHGAEHIWSRIKKERQVKQSYKSINDNFEVKSSYILLFVEKAQTMASFNIQLTPGSGSVLTM